MKLPGRATVTAAAMLALASPAAGIAQTAPAFAPSPAATDDGRLLGHLSYPQADAATLVPAPAGFAIGQPCRVQAAMLPDLARLIDAETAAGLGETVHAISCFRSVAHQQAVFCRGRRGCADPERRAVTVGPPGHSEHATGYAIDVAVRPARGCPDLSPCLATTAAGQWLTANAPAYGFELSFPDGNAQDVAYEPWHWRWVGTSQDEPGAAEARATLAEARVRFPARPEQAGFALRLRPTTDAPQEEAATPDADRR